VLSEAGKPIYSRHGNEEALAATMGVMMALVSFIQSGGDAIRAICSGTGRGERGGWSGGRGSSTGGRTISRSQS